VSRSSMGICSICCTTAGQQGRGGNQKGGVLHVFGIGRLIAELAHVLDEGKGLIPDDPQHLFRIVQVLEVGPADVLLASGKGGVLE
jgi:hypothetical protein